MSAITRFLPRIQNLPAYLRLRPGYLVVEEQPGQFLLHSGAQSFKISLPFPGISLVEFFDQLSGQQPLAEILKTLSPVHINFLLDVAESLHRSGLLVSSREDNKVDPRYTASANLFDQFRQIKQGDTPEPFLSESAWQERISQSRVGLIGLGRIGSQLARLLTIVGVQNITGIDKGLVDKSLRYTDAWYFEADKGDRRIEALNRNLTALNPKTRFSSLPISLDELENDRFPDEFLDMDVIVVASDQLRPKLYDRINYNCIQTGIPWTSYRINWAGLAVEIGPTVLPKETACYECYQYRRRSNLANPAYDDALVLALEGRNPPLLDLPITPCLSLFCYEILRLLSGEIQPRTLGAIIEFDVSKAELVRHPLLKVPRCPACRRDIQPFAPVRFWSEISAVDNKMATSTYQTREDL